MKDNIKVNIDITKDQILPDSASKLQVEIATDETVAEYHSPDGTRVTGDNLVVTKIELTNLKDLQVESAYLGEEIIRLQAEKDRIDALIPSVEEATNQAIINLRK